MFLNNNVYPVGYTCIYVESILYVFYYFILQYIPVKRLINLRRNLELEIKKKIENVIYYGHFGSLNTMLLVLQNNKFKAKL